MDKLKATVMPKEDNSGQQSQGMPGIQLPNSEQNKVFETLEKSGVDSKQLNSDIKKEVIKNKVKSTFS